MSLSNYAENLILDWLLSTASATRPTAWYMALHTGAPGETGANEVVVGTDADYVRKSITFAAAASGEKASDAAVSWTVDTASAGYTVTHLSIWDASTAGNCLFIGELAIPKALVADEVWTFAIAKIKATLD